MLTVCMYIVHWFSIIAGGKFRTEVDTRTIILLNLMQFNIERNERVPGEVFVGVDTLLSPAYCHGYLLPLLRI